MYISAEAGRPRGRPPKTAPVRDADDYFYYYKILNAIIRFSYTNTFRRLIRFSRRLYEYFYDLVIN